MSEPKLVWTCRIGLSVRNCKRVHCIKLGTMCEHLLMYIEK